MDYIEETGQRRSTTTSEPQHLQQMAARIKQLETENATLYDMTENLKYSEAVSRHKVEDLSNQVHSLSQERINLET